MGQREQHVRVLGQAELSASGCRGAVLGVLFLFSSSYPTPKITHEPSLFPQIMDGGA